jgi:hypothetical protein
MGINIIELKLIFKSMRFKILMRLEVHEGGVQKAKKHYSEGVQWPP